MTAVLFVLIVSSVASPAACNPFRLVASRQATFPKGTALGYAGKFSFST